MRPHTASGAIGPPRPPAPVPAAPRPTSTLHAAGPLAESQPGSAVLAGCLSSRARFEMRACEWSWGASFDTSVDACLGAGGSYDLGCGEAESRTASTGPTTTSPYSDMTCRDAEAGARGSEGQSMAGKPQRETGDRPARMTSDAGRLVPWSWSWSLPQAPAFALRAPVPYHLSARRPSRFRYSYPV